MPVLKSVIAAKYSQNLHDKFMVPNLLM
jgi:hypothetical protein